MTDVLGLLEGFEERILERRGVRLRYFVGGTGPPLLLVHGFGGSAWNFAELAPLLAVMLAMEIGFSRVLLLGALAYFLAFLVLKGVKCEK